MMFRNVFISIMLYNNSPPYFIVLASSVKTMEVAAISVSQNMVFSVNLPCITVLGSGGSW